MLVVAKGVGSSEALAFRFPVLPRFCTCGGTFAHSDWGTHGKTRVHLVAEALCRRIDCYL